MQVVTLIPGTALELCSEVPEPDAIWGDNAARLVRSLTRLAAP